MWGSTHHKDARSEETPACFPPQPEDIAPVPHHHLNILDEIIHSWCSRNTWKSGGKIPEVEKEMLS